jgi:sulfopyruvate decarboxylase subunit beta
MLRFQAIQEIMDQVADELVVSNIGDPSKELYHIRDRPKNFYMLGSMGLASSISLGVALSQEEKVVCLDGDGSILMNLGSLLSIANNKPGNLILVVLDNGAYGTTGNQETFTSGETDLDEIARACGFKATFKAENVEGLSSVVKECLDTDSPSFVHVLIEADDIKFDPIPLDPIEIKSRFMKEIKGKT